MTWSFYYPLALAVLLLVGWPTSYTLTTPIAPWLPVWSALLATLLGGHEVLRTAAHTTPRPDDVQPIDWSRYTEARPGAVLVGKLIGCMVTSLSWSAIVTPLLFIASQLASYPFRFFSLYIYWFVLGLALAPWGVWTTSRITQRPIRAWLLTGLWTAVFLIPLLPIDLPTRVMGQFLEAAPARIIRQLAGPAAAEDRVLSLRMLYPLALIWLTGLALAWLELRHWASNTLHRQTC